MFWDLTVYPFGNYEAAGVWHHNSGKSLVSSAKVARFLLSTPPPEKLTPYWVLSQNMEMVTSTCWGQNLARFIPDCCIQDTVWYSAAKGLPRSVVLKPHRNGNSWLIEFKSYDQGRQALQGSSIGGCWFDEQVGDFSIIMEVLARTRKWSFPGSRLMSLTPVEPDLKLEEIANEPDRWPDWRVYRMNTRLNDRINPEFVRQIESNEIAELIETRLTGAFAVYQGQIFKDFNSRLHVVEPFGIPGNWTVFRGIDIGWSHNTACIWVARDHEGTFYAFREYLKSQTYIEAHVKAINDGWDGWPVKGGTWIDSANAQVVAEMELRGLQAQAANKEVKAGIGTIQSLLRPTESGKPRLYVFRTCENLIRQMRTYTWDEKRLDQPRKETAACLFDAVDALRYALHSSNKGLIRFSPLKLPDHKKRLGF